MRSKLTVTIVICAYNEQGNIGSLLSNLLAQKTSEISIQGIEVYNDGSTDRSAQLVRNIKNHKIQLFSFETCIGKTGRMRQAIRKNKTRVIVFIDADVVPFDEHVIENLCKPFLSDQHIMLTGGKGLETPARSLTERAVAGFNREFEFSVRSKWKKGQNIYAFRGMLFAVRTDFAKSFRLPSLGYEDNYYYLMALKKRLNVRYVPKACAWYHSPATPMDQINQGSRYVSNISVLSRYFDPKVVVNEFRYPISYNLKLTLLQLKRDPIAYLWMKSLSLICYVNRIHVSKSDVPKWKRIESSKLVNLKNYSYV